MDEDSGPSILNDHPSGHAHSRTLDTHDVHPLSVERGSATDYLRRNFPDFAGPYKDYNPPGDRTPAVGEKQWDDHPYLPSYQDPMLAKELYRKETDNLRFLGPFYRGFSETHAEYVNRGVLPGRTFHEYIRHYEEPGLAGDISETQAEFRPPRPMLPRDKNPCLGEEEKKEWYRPSPKEPQNPHAKELEYGTREPEVVYVDEGYKRDFSTEHGENYVCFHEGKKGAKIQDLVPKQKEVFLENIRESHRSCPHPPAGDARGDGCNDKCFVKRQCPGATPRRVDWLLQPSNNVFQNGVALVPCQCRYNDAARRAFLVDGRFP